MDKDLGVVAHGDKINTFSCDTFVADNETLREIRATLKPFSLRVESLSLLISGGAKEQSEPIRARSG